MPNRTAALILAALLPAAGALAANEVALTDKVTETIRVTLTDQGHEVGRIRIEDGLQEACARRDGQRLEIFMNADLEIVRTEADD